MAKNNIETEEILKASYRVELFIRKLEKQIQTALIYEPSDSIKQDIQVLNEFVKNQKMLIEDARKSLSGNSDYKGNYLDTEIVLTPLSTRTSLCLKSANITTVKDLIEAKNKYGLSHFKNFRNFGKTAYDEVVRFINIVETL
ncbi:DNA-directed RNA polymerase subunit alpha C-terminal domain-containing protein [Dyadobacter psychrophilus]|uniref:RNA polymerase, alpha chain C terminal domain n=1 Tax=Dyadobacter psychrophilus TaxID=651661 RepID=A0A1T5B6A0_9BACT|nr:DNA-directed RNA polymerase subunit alpha C-terminal domain-containing protein [Dyadobacter psychrophilus]SKB42587.1 RNA polymerase, alpha chain C terminal domain [Dyadobacter psychrophilus]